MNRNQEKACDEKYIAWVDKNNHTLIRNESEDIVNGSRIYYYFILLIVVVIAKFSLF